MNAQRRVLTCERERRRVEARGRLGDAPVPVGAQLLAGLQKHLDDLRALNSFIRGAPPRRPHTAARDAMCGSPQSLIAVTAAHQRAPAKAGGVCGAILRHLIMATHTLLTSVCPDTQAKCSALHPSASTASSACARTMQHRVQPCSVGVGQQSHRAAVR